MNTKPKGRSWSVAVRGCCNFAFILECLPPFFRPVISLIYIQDYLIPKKHFLAKKFQETALCYVKELYFPRDSGMIEGFVCYVLNRFKFTEA